MTVGALLKAARGFVHVELHRLNVGRPLATPRQTTTSSGAPAVFLVANQRGVQGVFSSSGATDELAVYSPYGVPTIKSGSDVTPFGVQGSYTSSTTDFTYVSGGGTPLDLHDVTTSPGTTNTSYLYGDLFFGGTARVLRSLEPLYTWPVLC